MDVATKFDKMEESMTNENCSKLDQFGYCNVDSVLMKNFRCFESLKVKFNTHGRTIREQDNDCSVGPLTVIVAKNGMGKSTVLDAVKIVFGTFTAAFDYPSCVHIDKSDIRIMTDGDSNQSTLALPVEIEADVKLAQHAYCVSRVLLRENGRTTTSGVKAIAEFGSRLKEQTKTDNTTVLPLIAFYGTSRLWKDHKNTDTDKPLLRSRDFGYDYCLSDDSNYKAVCQWTKDALLAELTENQLQLQKNNVLHQQLQAMRNALSGLLEQEGFSNFLHYNSYFKELAVTQKNEILEMTAMTSLPISVLSDGVRAIFAMVVDIAFRCAKLNPALGENACLQTPGIILIDEIDQHLHPAWQQKVIDTLQSAFPKMQFIVTTHSPQVVSAIPKECVRILNNGQVFEATIQTDGVESQDVLTQIFGTDAAPRQNNFVKMLDTYASMVAGGKADSEVGRAVYQKLVAHFGAQYAPLQRIEIQRKFFSSRRGKINA